MSQEKENLITILKPLQEKIGPIIEKILALDVEPKFRQAMSYQVLTGGKRVRPSLAILSCLALEGKIQDILYPAAGLEILHNFTLIIDDIIDHSQKRRNQPTTWAKYGKSIAECIAMNFSASLFQAANRSSKPVEISELFAKTIKKITEGEILDILFERIGRVDEPYVVKNRPRHISQDDYFDMISKKTASLFAASCEVGGICASGSKKERRSLRNYGFNLGLAFQIKDDILDIFGEEKNFGKKIGKDIEERKGGNIVLLLALQELPGKAKARVFKIMRQEKITKKAVREVISLVKETQAREKAMRRGGCFVEKAKDNLKTLPQNKWTDALATLADFVLERKK